MRINQKTISDLIDKKESDEHKRYEEYVFLSKREYLNARKVHLIKWKNIQRNEKIEI